MNLDDSTLGTIINFGKYYEDDPSKFAPLKFKVLCIDKVHSRALLATQNCIETMPFDKDGSTNEWEQSSIRKWLNNDFIKTAFSEQEQSEILLTKVNNSIDSLYAKSEAEDTEDKIFLLSESEVTDGIPKTELGIEYTTKEADPKKKNARDPDGPYFFLFNEKEDAIAPATQYSESKDCVGSYFLRSKGNGTLVCYVGNNGFVGVHGVKSDNPYYGIRPALWIKLD